MTIEASSVHSRTTFAVWWIVLVKHCMHSLPQLQCMRGLVDQATVVFHITVVFSKATTTTA